MNDVVVGLDVGYSSVKMAYGAGSQPAIRLLNVGAAPVTSLKLRADGSAARNFGGGYEVLVKGEQWVGGAEPEAISSYAPVLHAGYTSSPQYMALFYAALLATNAKKIGCMVVGLPVSHYRDESKVEHLMNSLKGHHTVDANTTIEVDKVKVVPQPMGAYCDFLASLPSRTDGFKVTKDTTVLVVDPGHFSFDWCVFRNGFQPESSNSTPFSGAKILEDTLALIHKKDSKIVDPDKLMNAVRDGRSTIAVGATTLDYTQSLEEASKKVMDDNLTLLKNNLRNVAARSGVDVIALAGGAAAWCEKALVAEWPDALVYRAPNPIEANARGFWMVGKHELMGRGK